MKLFRYIWLHYYAFCCNAQFSSKQTNGNKRNKAVAFSFINLEIKFDAGYTILHGVCVDFRTKWNIFDKFLQSRWIESILARDIIRASLPGCIITRGLLNKLNVFGKDQ